MDVPNRNDLLDVSDPTTILPPTDSTQARMSRLQEYFHQQQASKFSHNRADQQALASIRMSEPDRLPQNGLPPAWLG